MDVILQTSTQCRGLISKIYNIITSRNIVPLNAIRLEWAEELGMNFSDEIWDHPLHRVNGSTSCFSSGFFIESIIVIDR